MKVQLSYLFGKWYWWDKRGGVITLRKAAWLNAEKDSVV